MSNHKQKKINLCHIASGDLWAGAEVQVCNIIQGLINTNKYCITAIIMNHGVLIEKLKKMNIDVYLVDEAKHSLVKQIFMMRKIIRKNKIQLIHSHRYKENIFAGIIKLISFKNIKLIKTQHGTFDVIKGISSYTMRIYRALDLICTKYLFHKIVGVSDDISNQFREIIRKNKILTISNSICVDSYNVLKDKRMLSSYNAETIHMAVIGRLVKIKNIDDFIVICKLLLKKGMKVKAYVVGNGPEKDRLIRKTRELGMSDDIEFVGYTANISEIYNNIDFLFVTSIHEGQPTVILEAMYFGKIIIAHKVGGIPEIIDHNKNGFLYNKIEQARDLVLQISKKLNKYEYIRINGRETVEEKYTNRIQSEKYSQLYKNIITNTTL